MANILLIEDDATLATIITDILITNGYAVEQHEDGNNITELIKQKAFDLLILDVMLPGKDGYELAKLVKQQYFDLPIIFLSSRSQHHDILNGFKVGASDYIKKPFHFEELLARVAIHIKNKQHSVVENAHHSIRIGTFVFMYEELLLIQNTNKIKLSYKEAELLKVLCDHVNQNISKYDIMTKVWGDTSASVNKLLDVYITKLRHIFKNDTLITILNIRGFGYKLLLNE